jgi:hypothetical protein
MVSGYPNDVNNTIAFGDVYNFNDFPTDIGTPDAGLPDTAPTQDVMPSVTGVDTNNAMNSSAQISAAGKPAYWWLTLFGMFALFVFLARKYGGGDSYSNIKASVYNLFFLTIFIVLMLNFLKVIAANWKIPGFSELVLAA